MGIANFVPSTEEEPMSPRTLYTAGISGVGMSFPERRLTNADLEKMVDTNDAWIVERTGIRERRIVEKGTGASVHGTMAAEQALGWLLAGYAFNRYAGVARPQPRLVVPAGVDAARIEAIAGGEAKRIVLCDDIPTVG